MRSTMADQLNMPVTYMGENPVGQLMFANGTLLVTDLFATPQEAVARFGKRIRAMKDEMKFSAPYQEGMSTAQAGGKYAPTRAYGRQAVLEYGTGYIRGLLEAPLPAAPVVYYSTKKIVSEVKVPDSVATTEAPQTPESATPKQQPDEQPSPVAPSIAEAYTPPPVEESIFDVVKIKKRGRKKKIQ